jgi:polysaccharide deacetylase family protein (PEP-CTERM system associated)
MHNLLTIDVEDWFHPSALDPYLGPDRWDHLESRVEANVHRLLEILATHQTQATFFILGWVAERYPRIVKEIQACGHHIASHGYMHRLIYNLSPARFREFVTRSKHLLEDLTGQMVQGYRATSFSIMPKTLWALDIIQEAGFTYDASIFPIRHDIYGMENAPRFPFRYANGLIEIPASTFRILGRNVPVAGGGYFRLYPYWFTRHCIKHINQEGYPIVMYFHPWEIDPGFPFIRQAHWRTRFRQYTNLGKTGSRLQKLLSDFSFMPIEDYLKTQDLKLLPA